MWNSPRSKRGKGCRFTTSLEYAGGNADGRNVKGKLRSFHSALLNSYQAEWITFNDKRYRCLINPSRLTENFDKKVLSIDFDAGIKEGMYMINRGKQDALKKQLELHEVVKNFKI